MKKYTQEEFNNFHISEKGFRICPSGDYTDIKVFGDKCRFASGCRFDDHCSFGEVCKFCQGCTFGNGCGFGNMCIFGKGCSFGKYCSFGMYCKFSKWCVFDEYCDFANMCSFDTGCICEFGPFDKMLTVVGFGNYGRPIYFFRLTNGKIFIRWGYFSGSLERWKIEVSKTRKEMKYFESYLLLAQAVEEAVKCYI